MAIIISFLLTISLWFFLQENYGFSPRIPRDLISAILIICAFIGTVGFLDDSSIVNVRARHKIFGEVLVALITVYVFEVHSGTISFAGMFSFPLWFSKIISALWILGIINAFNIMDGVDGLAGGITLIAILTTTALLGIRGQEAAAIICLILAGSIIGFLFHNMPPAKAFLGDTGSLFLGAMVAVLTLHLASTVTGTRTIVVVPLIVGVPVAEVLVTMVRRYFRARDKKLPLFKRIRHIAAADNLHIHHRFIFRGFTHLETALTLFIIAFTLSCGVVCLLFVPRYFIIPVLCYLAVPLVIELDLLEFGGRFKKALGISKYRYSGYEKVELIGILDNDGLLAYSLERQKGSGLIFIPLNKEDLSTLSTSIKAAVIRDSGSEGNRENLQTAKQLSSMIHGPVYLVRMNSDSRLSVNEVKRNGTLVVWEDEIATKEFIKKLLAVCIPGRRHRPSSSVRVSAVEMSSGVV